MKRITLIVVVLAVALMSVGVAGAQDFDRNGPRGNRTGEFVDLLTESLGVDAQTLAEALREEGATPASVIASFGGDVAAIQAEMVNTIIANNPDFDSAEVEERVANWLANGFDGPRSDRDRGEFLQAAADALETDVASLIEALREEGATPTSVIESFGGDVAAIEAEIVSTITTNNPNLNAEQVEERVANWLENGFEGRGERRDGRPQRGGDNQPPANGGDA